MSEPTLSSLGYLETPNPTAIQATEAAGTEAPLRQRILVSPEGDFFLGMPGYSSHVPVLREQVREWARLGLVAAESAVLERMKNAEDSLA